MALLSFVESAPRAYRLKVGNADLFRNSTEPGTSPGTILRSSLAARKRSSVICRDAEIQRLGAGQFALDEKNDDTASLVLACLARHSV